MEEIIKFKIEVADINDSENKEYYGDTIDRSWENLVQIIQDKFLSGEILDMNINYDEKNLSFIKYSKSGFIKDIFYISKV